jgi:hypothetical protein
MRRVIEVEELMLRNLFGFLAEKKKVLPEAPVEASEKS